MTLLLNATHMTIKLTKVSTTYLEPIQTPMRDFFCKNS